MSGWLALAVSLAVHAAGLLVLWYLPAGPDGTEHPPAPVNTCVVISDDEPSGVDHATSPEPAPTQIVDVVAVSPTVLPTEPVPADGSDPPAPQGPASAGPAVGGTTGSGTPGGAAEAGRRGTTFFQVAAEGASVVYVIDCSASMGLNGGLAAARRELLASLGQLPESAHFQVIAYNRTASPLRIGGRDDLVPADPDNVHETVALLARLRASGSTNHVEALRRALALEPEVIFLVTDADDLTPEQVRRVTQWNAGRAAIHAIELSGRDDSRPGGPLEALAHANGGTYRFVPLAEGG